MLKTNTDSLSWPARSLTDAILDIFKNEQDPKVQHDAVLGCVLAYDKFRAEQVASLETRLKEIIRSRVEPTVHRVEKDFDHDL